MFIKESWYFIFNYIFNVFEIITTAISNVYEGVSKSWGLAETSENSATRCSSVAIL